MPPTQPRQTAAWVTSRRQMRAAWSITPAARLHATAAETTAGTRGGGKGGRGASPPAGGSGRFGQGRGGFQYSSN